MKEDLFIIRKKKMSLGKISWLCHEILHLIFPLPELPDTDSMARITSMCKRKYFKISMHETVSLKKGKKNIFLRIRQ